MSAFTILDLPQRSAEWFAARAGRLTGSRASDMLAKIKSGEAAARRDLRVQLVVERLTGSPQEDTYINTAMQWGIDHEADAFAEYEALTGNLTRRTGFIAHNTLPIGCSLDGDVDELGGIVEVKCPFKSAIHYGYLKAGVVPPGYVPQILHNLWVTGAQFADFLSFDPRMPPSLRVFYVRMPRIEIDVLAYAKCAEAFLAEVEAEYDAALALHVAQVA